VEHHDQTIRQFDEFVQICAHQLYPKGLPVEPGGDSGSRILGRRLRRQEGRHLEHLGFEPLRASSGTEGATKVEG
jgi:hypothetical protein